MAKAKRQTAADVYYQIHERVVLVIVRIVVLQICIGLLALLTNAALFAWMSARPDNTGLLLALTIDGVILQTIDAIFVIYIIVQWLRVSYIITPTELTIQNGIGRIGRRIYRLDHIKSVGYDQTFLGRFFNYGTVHIEFVLDETITLPNIPDPAKHVELLRAS